MPVATRRACLHFPSWRIHFDLRPLSAIKSNSWRRNHSCSLSRRRKLIRERLHQNFCSLCSNPWIQNCGSQPHWSDWHNSSHITENFYIWWVTFCALVFALIIIRVSKTGTCCQATLPNLNTNNFQKIAQLKIACIQQNSIQYACCQHKKQIIRTENVKNCWVIVSKVMQWFALSDLCTLYWLNVFSQFTRETQFWGFEFCLFSINPLTQRT